MQRRRKHQCFAEALVQSAGLSNMRKTHSTWKVPPMTNSKWHHDFRPCPHRLVLQHIKQHPNTKGEATSSGMAMDTHEYGGPQRRYSSHAWGRSASFSQPMHSLPQKAFMSGLQRRWRLGDAAQEEVLGLLPVNSESKYTLNLGC